MQKANLLKEYKKILGRYCAINQFVELTNRCFVAEHKEEIINRDTFISLASQYSVTLTNYDSIEMVRLVSRSYIVNIHLCFESFLKSLCSQINKYGSIEFTEKVQSDSWLQCAIKNTSKDNLTKEIQSYIDLCEYYRLIRNSSVHDLINIDKHTREYSALSKYNYKTDAKFNRLSAPNAFDNINFDDFIMFARTTIELATYLYNNISYDYSKIVKSIPKSTQSKWKKYNQSRLEQAIHKYISTNFQDSEALKAELPYLSTIIVTQ